MPMETVAARGGDDRATIVVACATHRDCRELPRVAPQHDYVWHEYACDALEDIVASRPRGRIVPADPDAEIERLIDRARAAGATAIISTDDYTYAIALDLALGRSPRVTPSGRHRHAVSSVLRTFDDAFVEHVPSASEVAVWEAADPDVRIEVLAEPNLRLSEEMQDGSSYRYGIVSTGGASRADAIARAARIERTLRFKFAASAASTG